MVRDIGRPYNREALNTCVRECHEPAFSLALLFTTPSWCSPARPPRPLFPLVTKILCSLRSDILFWTSERCIASPAPNRNRASSKLTNSAKSVSGPGTLRARTVQAGLPAILAACLALSACERTRGGFGVNPFGQSLSGFTEDAGKGSLSNEVEVEVEQEKGARRSAVYPR